MAGEEALPRKLLVTGASRSGKSSFAISWAQAREAPRLFLATAKAMDPEMAERIRRHRQERGPGWVTLEEPLEVEKALLSPPAQVNTVVLDCVTLWLNNLIMEKLGDQEIKARAQGLCEALAMSQRAVAIVTNEVGWGIVPDNHLGRRFRDLAGLINQMLARAADQVILMVAGLPVVLKPARGTLAERQWGP